MGASQPRQCIQAAKGEGHAATVLDIGDLALPHSPSQSQGYKTKVVSSYLLTKAKVTKHTMATASVQDDAKASMTSSASGSGSGSRTDLRPTGDGGGSKRSLSSVRKQMVEERQANRPRITDQQMDTIRATWNIVKRDQRDIGLEMFARMFATYPLVKEAFSAFRYLSPEDQRFERELRAHGDRVLMLVDQLLMQDNDCRYDVTLLHELGFKHVTFNAKSDYLDLVGQQFLVAIETVMKDSWTTEVENSWATFLQFITYVMREAMIM